MDEFPMKAMAYIYPKELLRKKLTANEFLPGSEDEDYIYSRNFKETHPAILSSKEKKIMRKKCAHTHTHNFTCNSIDARAHKTALLMAENPFANDMFNPISLSGEEFTRIVTSSIPSFPITDHPSSLNPLSASLKPLQGICSVKAIDKAT